jgi:GMP reductase
VFDYTRLKNILDNINVKWVCIDVANGYMQQLVDFCKRVRENYPDKIIVAGNVVSREMTEELIINGKVDVVKVGIGGGSACVTRSKTGVGMPQLSAVIECGDAAHGVNGFIISDGGITCPGDMAEAYGGGADFVMMGGQFAGHDENPGELIEENGEQYKIFYGMSSEHAMKNLILFSIFLYQFSWILIMTRKLTSHHHKISSASICLGHISWTCNSSI